MRCQNHPLKFTAKEDQQEGPSPEALSDSPGDSLKGEDRPSDREESSPLQDQTASPENKEDIMKPEQATQEMAKTESVEDKDKPEQEAKTSQEDKPIDNQATDEQSANNQTTDSKATDKQEVTGHQEEEKEVPAESAKPEAPPLRLNGLCAIKCGMSSVYDAKGQIVPVTVLKFQDWRVTQIKTKEKDGYAAVQIGAIPKSQRKSNAAQKGHLKPAGFHSNVTFLREIRGDIPDQATDEDSKDKPSKKEFQAQVGQMVSIHSLAKGDMVHLSAVSKGRGFSGTMKRWGYGGGPASHGSQFHRKPGSVGMCEEPARVLPGKGMPGHYGAKQVTLKHVKIIDVLAKQNAILVKGGVPGASNGLVKLMKENV